MLSPSRWCWLFLFPLFLAACQAGGESNDWSSVDSGLSYEGFDPDAREVSRNKGKTVTLDDVTNGVQNNSSRGLQEDLGAGGWDDKIVTGAPPGQGFTTYSGTRFADANDDGIPDQLVTAERMLVHRGDLRVEVARPEEAMASFRDQVVAWGGHLQSQADQTLVVRVPVQHFDAAFAWVKHAGRVLSESRRADDVTEEFVDLGIRLDTARKARDRLLEVLQKADKVEDILKIEAELRRLTEEIERMEGRKKFLADQVALATLSATFQATADVPVKRGARQASRFPWINRIGAERVAEDFR
jgi:hypothetical protein